MIADLVAAALLAAPHAHKPVTPATRAFVAHGGAYMELTTSTPPTKAKPVSKGVGKAPAVSSGAGAPRSAGVVAGAPAVAQGAQQAAAAAPVRQYTWAYACPGASPNNTVDTSELCQSAINACSATAGAGGNGDGPLIRIFARDVSPTVTGWRTVGTSCDPNSVPANTPAPAAAPGAPPPPPPPPPRPVLTMAMIRAAFHRTPFTPPTVHAQPEGNTTLIRLPVYLQVRWPQQGYQPDEIETLDPATMLGYRVRIRPTLTSLTYHFGDGTTIGPTTDPGGPYPTGTITHPYSKPGRYTTSITATYGGQVSVNGGPWTTITDTTTLTGPTQPITVKTATNQLVR